MDSKTLIKQVKECQKNNWHNSDLGRNSEDMLEEIAGHFETCAVCRKDFDAGEYLETNLIDFENRLEGTVLSDWIHSEKVFHEFKIFGIEAVEKNVVSGNQSSARINVPPHWQGRKVILVRLE